MRKVLTLAALAAIMLLSAPLFGADVTAMDIVAQDAPGTAGAVNLPEIPAGDSTIPQVIEAAKELIAAGKQGGAMAITAAALFLLLLLVKLQWVRSWLPAAVRRWLPVISMTLGAVVMMLFHGPELGWWAALQGLIAGGTATGIYEAIVGAIGGKRAKS